MSQLRALLSSPCRFILEQILLHWCEDSCSLLVAYRVSAPVQSVHVSPCILHKSSERFDFSSYLHDE